MTKAKAIEVLNEAYDGFLIAEKVCSDAFKDEITDRKIALLTAIDALEQSSSVEAELDKRVVMDEYISKQSVIDYLNGYLNSIGEDGTYSPLFDRGQRRALINSIQDISAIKAADVQPVKQSGDRYYLGKAHAFCIAADMLEMNVSAETMGEATELNEALGSIDDMIDIIGKQIIRIAYDNRDFICSRCLSTAYVLYGLMEKYAREEDTADIRDKWKEITGVDIKE